MQKCIYEERGCDNMRSILECGDVLIDMGISPRLKGFDYICLAIDIIHDNPNDKHIMSIYKTIADNFDVSEESVERSIRHAFSKVIDDDVSKKWFGSAESNSEKLYTLEYRLEREVHKRGC